MMTGLKAFLGSERGGCRSHIHEDELKLGGVKIIADEVTGSLRPCQKELNEMIALIHKAGCQAAVHAIESTVIKAAGKAIAFAIEKAPKSDPRHRIEHCSVCGHSLLQRLAQMGTVVVTQPAFLYYNGERYLKTVPVDELSHLYDVQSMLQSGLRVGVGSDFPIADPNPWVSIYSAVTRRTESNGIISLPGIAVLEALRLHTFGSAEANFEEHIKGSLTPGKLADAIMLDEDPLTMEVERLKSVQVIMTMLGGQVI
jgi:predicted amidohydrolase YtcJ